LAVLTVPCFGVLEKQLKKPPPCVTGSLNSSFLMLRRDCFLLLAELVCFDKSANSLTGYSAYTRCGDFSAGAFLSTGPRLKDSGCSIFDFTTLFDYCWILSCFSCLFYSSASSSTSILVIYIVSFFFFLSSGIGDFEATLVFYILGAAASDNLSLSSSVTSFLSIVVFSILFLVIGLLLAILVF
jgi:hypothetical protein